MHREAKELLAFIRAIEKDPRDVKLRSVFANWLEEHDEPEEAAIHRGFNLKKHDAEVWMREFCHDNVADYDELLESIGKGQGYCFGNDSGPEAVQYDEQFWENVRILLERDDVNTEQTFRCGC